MKNALQAVKDFYSRHWGKDTPKPATVTVAPTPIKMQEEDIDVSLVMKERFAGYGFEDTLRTVYKAAPYSNGTPPHAETSIVPVLERALTYKTCFHPAMADASSAQVKNHLVGLFRDSGAQVWGSLVTLNIEDRTTGIDIVVSPVSREAADKTLSEIREKFWAAPQP